VAREVGTEGKLGGQANVRGGAGTWKDLTDSVNSMAGNLTAQVRNIAAVTTAVANGDLSKKITVDVKGEILELKDTINTMVDQLRSFASEVTRVAREVGTEGKLGGQADVRGVAGTWKDLTDSVNSMAGNLTAQVRNIAAVTTAVANGDLSKKITVDVKGEILELKDTINTMVDQLSSFAAEVTRVAREVGTEGNLGGQADVQGVSGVWKDLTDNVNFMASNLTSQVRGIARVVTAVAGGTLNRKLTVEAKGEIAELSDTINSMIDTLATFADQVTTVAREVGVEGKLGGQASVPGAAGTWKALTDNVNQLAQNLTTQVRAIAEVATAVTKGDLTRSITVEALGEVAALKDNINEMIRNLKDTTLKNSEQDWLKTNLAKFSRMLQGERDLLTVGKMTLSELAPVVAAQQGVLYTLDHSEEKPKLKLLASYGHTAHDAVGPTLGLGDGLIGQCAIEKRQILLSSVPPDYIRISSGLGNGTPATLVVLPVLFEGTVKAVLELASFERFSPTHLAFLDQLMESIGIVLNTIEANTRTEDLLKQSQSLAAELQAQQEELRQTNQQLGEKAKLLADQNVEVERKNREVEQARQDLEEKAKQLALTSKFKSEFLANMSHELRTPLNSLLILSDQLSRNQGANLTDKQVQFAKTIHASGNDLLGLINDILDLSKIESGTVAVDIEELQLHELVEYVDRTFRHVAEAKKLEFGVNLAENLPGIVHTDSKRLQQVLKNLLSNAFKFTETGRVSLRIAPAASGWSRDHETLNGMPSVIAISVSDTGIGIPLEKQKIIFEAFQQADGSTSRKYGGTGLGLAISRELSRLLGGELVLTSQVNQGSTFTLYLPQSFTPLNASSGAVAPEAVLPHRDVFSPNLETQLACANIPEAAMETATAGVESFATGAPAMLIIENDMTFSQIMRDMGREQGFRTLVTAFGASGLTLARERKPDAITLDIRLPDMEGWRVLGRLKAEVELRHIPVYVISTDEDRRRALAMGAMAVLSKPVKTREALEAVFSQIKRVLARTRQQLVVVTEDDAASTEISGALCEQNVDIRIIPPTTEAMTEMTSGSAGCVVVRPPIRTMALTLLLSTLAEQLVSQDLPIIIYAKEPLDADVEGQLTKAAQTLMIKRVMSAERLMDEVALYLHWPFAQLTPAQQQILRTLYENDDVLHGRTVLIVDDDIRNIFAMTSVLEQHGMNVLSAECGQQAIEQLNLNANIEMVLMDIMMPDMDGFDTMRAIRRIPRLKSLPIVAVTAKAMKGDRERCIEAGAWDYLSKPVDPLQMVSSCRAWLRR
jgi:signal transduction histidine kinase/CheY-like chemotaxis protein/HAMP domain-containing protein